MECKLGEETGGRQGNGVACPARADGGLCWAAVSWSLGLFGQELAHEEELADPATRTDAQVGRAGAGLMVVMDGGGAVVDHLGREVIGALHVQQQAGFAGKWPFVGMPEAEIA